MDLGRPEKRAAGDKVQEQRGEILLAASAIRTSLEPPQGLASAAANNNSFSFFLFFFFFFFLLKLNFNNEASDLSVGTDRSCVQGVACLQGPGKPRLPSRKQWLF